MQLLIELANISFSYNTSKRLLDNLNFKLFQGEKVALLGENGSGKTTLFHIIMGLIPVKEGEIFIFGNKVKSEDDFRKVRTKIGFLFQDSDDQLFSPTVLDDVAFGPLNIGYKGEEAKKIAEETLKKLSISHLKNRITYKLSGGEKRMVALATILAMSPKILLLDEPTNGIDRKHLELLIDFLKNTNLSFVIISHNEDFINQVTNKKILLQNGKITNLS